MRGIFIGDSMFWNVGNGCDAGQITVPIMWIMLYFAGLESKSVQGRSKQGEVSEI